MQSARWLVALAVVLHAGAAAAAGEPSDLALRFGFDVGGGWTSNVNSNVYELGDMMALARMRIDADYLPSDSMVVKAFYRADLEAYRDVSEERNVGQAGELTLGVRPMDTLYVAFSAGGEHAYYPDWSPYTFGGGFGRVGARLELGDTLTAKVSYRLRHDVFPSYDLDNTSHQGEASLLWAAGDHVEVELPVLGDLVLYGERHLYDETGAETSKLATGRRIVIEPQVRVFPTFDVSLRAAVRGEINASDDTYFAAQPIGGTDPAVPAPLVQHYYSYRTLAGTLEARLEPLDQLYVGLRVTAGLRGYDYRYAFDRDLAPTTDLQSDQWLEPAMELRLRLARNVSLWAAYAYLRQWSNDPMWEFDAHRVQVTTSFSFGS